MVVNISLRKCNLSGVRTPCLMPSEYRGGMADEGAREVSMKKVRLKQLVHGFGKPLLHPPAALQYFKVFCLPKQSALHTRDKAFRHIWKCEAFHIKP